MKNKIKKYFETPLTKGWLWEKAAIVLFIVVCYMFGRYGKRI